MSREIIRLEFIENESTFEFFKFVLHVNKISSKRYLAELFVSICDINQCKLNGLGEFEGKVLLPMSVFNLSPEKREQVIGEKYKDRLGSWFVMFAHNRCLKVIKYSKQMSYFDFLEWARNGLIGNS